MRRVLVTGSNRGLGLEFTRQLLAAGDRVFARIDPAQAHFFDTASGQSLGVRL